MSHRAANPQSKLPEKFNGKKPKKKIAVAKHDFSFQVFAYFHVLCEKTWGLLSDGLKHLNPHVFFLEYLEDFVKK